MPLRVTPGWKLYTEDYIRLLLTTSSVAVERGLVAIYKLQTPTEQEASSTAYHNRLGFSAVHAPLGCSLAEQILRMQDKPPGWRLTLRQLEAGRELILHYARQLTNIANGKIKVEKNG